MKKLRIVNKSNNALPEYATEDSAGFDLRADVSEPVKLRPFERKLVKTGLFLELPERYEAQIRPRSGLALKSGITVLNAPGTIDADYRGGNRCYPDQPISGGIYDQQGRQDRTNGHQQLSESGFRRSGTT